MNGIGHLEAVIARARDFESAAHTILGTHEASRSRIISVEATYGQLQGMSLQQDDQFRQSLRCVEHQLFRAAHVLSWAGFMDYFEAKLASDGFIKLRAARTAWTFRGIEDLREQITEYQIIESGRDVGLCTKNETKALHGLLNKRNECAHPSSYYPGLNETLGFISELLNRVSTISTRQL